MGCCSWISEEVVVVKIIKDLLYGYLNANSDAYKRTLFNAYKLIMDSLKENQRKRVLNDVEIIELLNKINKR